MNPLFYVIRFCRLRLYQFIVAKTEKTRSHWRKARRKKRSSSSQCKNVGNKCTLRQCLSVFIVVAGIVWQPFMLFVICLCCSRPSLRESEVCVCKDRKIAHNFINNKLIKWFRSFFPSLFAPPPTTLTNYYGISISNYCQDFNCFIDSLAGLVHSQKPLKSARLELLINF